jgi:hypothetical protein
LDILDALLQGDYLGGHGVNDSSMLFSISLEHLDFFSLPLHLLNEVVDHIGQLLNLDVLSVDSAIKLIDNVTYLIGHLTNKVDLFGQMVNQVVLLTVDILYGQLELMDLGQQVGSHCS